MKKSFSIILALIMMVMSALPVFAATEHNPDTCKDAPVVIVRGMDFMGLYIDEGTENERPAVTVDAGKIVGTVFHAIFAGLFNLNFDPVVDEVIGFANELLGNLEMTGAGESLYNISPRKYPGSVDNYPEIIGGTGGEMGMITACAEEFGADHTYYFTYDWRRDPFDIADEINEMIETACEETGHDKVKLVCASMGGIMTVAYLTEYGYDRVERVLFMSSTFCGVQMPSDMLRGKIDFDADAISNIAGYAMKDNAALNVLYKILDFTGAFKLAESISAKIVENYLEDVNDRVLMRILAYMPVMWALVQPEDFEACVDYVFGDSMEENAAFIARVTKLQEMVNGRNELIYEMMENGVDVAVASHYGAPLIPVYEGASKLSGDMVLEAKQTSGYATVAPYGETLGDDYVAENPALLSPDRMVDLSTAILPEYTYMIKQAPHVACGYGTDYGEFFMWLLTEEGSLAAGSNPDYPQFMISGNDESLSKF